MIGVVPGISKTFIVAGKFNDTEPIEGYLYADPVDNRLYLYSQLKTRSNPDTEYFPIWDGNRKIISGLSNKKYLDTDMKSTNISDLSSTINNDMVEKILYQHRVSTNNGILSPTISDEDNMFTQCIKGILNVKKYTLVDLAYISSPPLSESMIENYYSSLTKITFMRLDKWEIWMNTILHMRCNISVYKDGKELLTYRYPEDTFSMEDTAYMNSIHTKDDPLKKIIKIIMVMNNMTKSELKSNDVDDYTINNMMTTIISKKSISSQLFSRFIRMAQLNYTMQVFDKDQMIFEYKE